MNDAILKLTLQKCTLSLGASSSLSDLYEVTYTIDNIVKPAADCV